MKVTATIRTEDRVPLLQAVKTSVAMILAWLVAQLLLPGELPVFAAIAALLVVQPSINQSLSKAIERSIGVILGVLIAYGVGFFFGSSTWIVLLAIVLCVMLSWLFRLSPGSSNQIPISAMLVLSIGASTPNYALERIIETIIGAVIALLVNVIIVPPVALAPAKDAVARLVSEVANTLDNVAAALIKPRTSAELQEMMIEARLLRPMQTAADKAIGQADESLTLNPRQGKLREELQAEIDLNEKLSTLVTRAIGMTRAVRDHYDDSLHLEPTVRALSLELKRAAHDLRLLGRHTEDPENVPVPEAESQPALTAPLRIHTPHPQHWILIGSLMEDLRRVREEITGE
ncbi:FUSC family protein [Leifsonia sp. A12D58]|uniref:FUSC family protein n=1 Tax=Leifsonia sp. A12D58 TaxID=3397674 RepID=UPI0039E09D4D